MLSSDAPDRTPRCLLHRHGRLNAPSKSGQYQTIQDHAHIVGVTVGSPKVDPALPATTRCHELQKRKKRCYRAQSCCLAADEEAMDAEEDGVAEELARLRAARAALAAAAAQAEAALDDVMPNTAALSELVRGVSWSSALIAHCTARKCGKTTSIMRKLVPLHGQILHAQGWGPGGGGVQRLLALQQEAQRRHSALAASLMALQCAPVPALCRGLMDITD